MPLIDRAGADEPPASLATPEEDLGAIATPWWVRPTSTGCGIVITAGVAVQRSVFVHPGGATALVLTAGATWVVAYLWPARPFQRLLPAVPPWWLWSAIVIAAVTVLMWRYPLYNTADLAPFVLVFLAGTMGTIVSFGRSLAVAVATTAPLLTATALYRFGGAAIWFLAVGMAWFFGAGFRWQLTVLEQLHAAQAGLAEKAAGEERRRIAGEIHDLVAHTLTVTTLHISAARLALRDGEPAEAVDALVEADRAARQAMIEIRGTVSLLGPAGGTARPLPTAGEIPALVGIFTGAGVDVDLSCALDGATVNGATGLTAYRIVQEALSNAVKHAPDQPVRVDVRADGAVLYIAVENKLPDGWRRGHEGLGVPGILDRASSAGGTATAAAADGVWRVNASLPLTAGTPV